VKEFRKKGQHLPELSLFLFWDTV